MQILEFRAMNTHIFMAADETRKAADGLERARKTIEASEARFSRFLPDSELSHLNHGAGDWQMVSEDLLELLNLAKQYHLETHGLFDPAILPDLKRVGYDRSMDELRKTGNARAANELPRRKHSFNQVELDLAGKRVLLPAGMEIDLGGLAKGWIVGKAASLLGSYSELCGVSAGGDIRFIGQPRDGSKWTVNLEDPRDPSQALAVLHVGEGAVATSSVAKRSWNQNGVQRHHLIDPRTGEPAQTEWLSVTVVGPDILAAEVYAKALLIGGTTEAAWLFASRPELAYITVDGHGNLLGSQTSKEYLNAFNYTYPR